MKKNTVFSVDTAVQVLWAIALAAIPVTSFRWFPFLGEGRTLVRPLAMIPLGLLLPLLFLQGVRRKRTLLLANALVPLGVFVLFVLASTGLGALLNPIPLYGNEYEDRALRALVTLATGLVFLLSALWMDTNESEFRFSLKWLLVGLCINFVWSGLQAVSFYTGWIDKEMLTQWQLAFSMRQLDRTNRISGLAFEPAWLAGQLATIYLPFLFAALLTNFRLTSARWLEPVLLILSTLGLLSTYSRGGLLTAILAAGLTALLVGRKTLRSIWHWFLSGFHGRRMDGILRAGIILALLGALGASALFLGRKNIFRNLLTARTDSLSAYMVGINAGARGAYLAGAWAAYEMFPLTGVGLGASGFYIYENLPDWSLTTVPEIARQQSPENRLYPNPKNMYARLLAEAGLIGFVLYLAFQFHLLGDAFALFFQSQEAWRRFAAVAGIFAWFAVNLYNSTQDSFATPNIWLVAGMILGLGANRSFQSPSKGNDREFYIGSKM